MKTFSTYCDNQQCDGNNPHYWIAAATGQQPPYKMSHELVGIEDGHWVGRCVCGNINKMLKPEAVHGKPRYPQYHAGLDKTFESRAEERAYAKSQGLTEVGVGVKTKDINF